MLKLIGFEQVKRINQLIENVNRPFISIAPSHGIQFEQNKKNGVMNNEHPRLDSKRHFILVLASNYVMHKISREFDIAILSSVRDHSLTCHFT